MFNGERGGRVFSLNVRKISSTKSMMQHRGLTDCGGGKEGLWKRKIGRIQPPGRNIHYE